MLVLSRKPGQEVVIGERKYVVRVHSIKGNTVRLLFDIPKDVPVLRSELVQRGAA
jgi:carbon storage regulator CsrA